MPPHREILGEIMTHPVDVHVGRRLRAIRNDCRMTQSELAAEVGIKFQQIQKYESGANRISASRLWDISSVLDVDIAVFFHGLEKQHGVQTYSGNVTQISYEKSTGSNA